MTGQELEEQVEAVGSGFLGSGCCFSVSFSGGSDTGQAAAVRHVRGKQQTVPMRWSKMLEKVREMFSER